jgi:hypothetical protein
VGSADRGCAYVAPDDLGNLVSRCLTAPSALVPKGVARSAFVGYDRYIYMMPMSRRFLALASSLLITAPLGGLFLDSHHASA